MGGKMKSPKAWPVVHNYLAGEEKEIIGQLDLFEQYDFFKNLAFDGQLIRPFFLIRDAGAETLPEEEKEIISLLDLCQDMTLWQEMAKGNEYLVSDIYNIGDEEWAMLETTAYIDEDLVDYSEQDKEE